MLKQVKLLVMLVAAVLFMNGCANYNATDKPESAESQHEHKCSHGEGHKCSHGEGHKCSHGEGHKCSHGEGHKCSHGEGHKCKHCRKGHKCKHCSHGSDEHQHNCKKHLKENTESPKVNTPNEQQ